MTKTPQTILLAEPDSNARAFLDDNLVADGYRVLCATDRAKTRALLTVTEPDLILLSIEQDTLSVIDEVRTGEDHPALDPDTPLIVLSERPDELHRIRVLERGGDDVLSKPFSYPELRARIDSLLRRAGARRAASVLRAGPLRIDRRSRAVTVAGRPVSLCRMEYELLVALASDPERVFTKTELLRSVWQFPTPVTTRTVDSHACRLRRKLSAAGGRCVVAVWGVGYRCI
jgi:DNA-binding response OmpR family regulator